ncbi:hypothetical protein M2164_003339 [Streptomyces sp. SAI-208]|uniref:DUF6281 family protein n=1 Tax=unclassified Streptomyces TaxID=2593676 RepID=UPI002476B699|nr:MULTISPECIES: DUF6281 family protein [unclassified Streptomyces]MDH6568167.1 hypothetical protein [Streptomyces sp. SAI-117]MDH6586883.1 hypothetical protein [Streptomyces sp. SAI-133]MDH6607704.1 hypothetical protein [Streptomyces sp. SAI-208]
MPTARLVMTVATLMVVLGCSSGGEAAGSCAGVVTYEDRDYLPTPGENFTVGERLGTARVQECDDTPGDDEVAVAEGTTGAYLVEGRDPAEAIAVGDTPSGARLMEIR